MNQLPATPSSTSASIESLPFKHLYQYRPPFTYPPTQSMLSVASSSSAISVAHSSSSIPMNPTTLPPYVQSSAYSSSLSSPHAIQYEGKFTVVPLKIYKDPYLPSMGFDHSESIKKLAKLSCELFDIKSPQQEPSSLLSTSQNSTSTAAGTGSSGFFSAFRRQKSPTTLNSPSPSMTAGSTSSTCASPTLSVVSSIASSGSSGSSSKSKANSMMDEYFRKACHSLLKPNNHFISKWIVSPRLAAKEAALYELFRNRSEPAQRADEPNESEDTLYFLFHYVGSILMWRNLFGFDIVSQAASQKRWHSCS